MDREREIDTERKRWRVCREVLYVCVHIHLPEAVSSYYTSENIACVCTNTHCDVISCLFSYFCYNLCVHVYAHVCVVEEEEELV